MDHLLSPRFPKHDPIEIPYLSTEEYDGGPLETYPERKGWSTIANPASTLSFVQTWLYFGLLKTVFKEPMNMAAWTSDKVNPHRIIVNTSVLPQIASDWIDKQRNLDQATRKKGRIETRTAVVFVARCLKGLYSAAENPTALKIILSIELLGEFLQSASLRAYDSSPLRDWREHETDEVNWMKSENFKRGLIYQRLHADGWCKYEIASFVTKFSGSGLYYISNLNPPSATKNHSKCTEFKCFAYQLVEKEYKTQHAIKGCDCPYVYDESDLVRSILEAGSIPLVSFLGNDNTETLRIVEAVPELEYVAISHVWSDGLGNLDHNALPICQLRRLSSLAAAALQHINKTCAPIFWVDTVCCPPESGNAQDLAISRMRDTYEKASCVLVLDSWLQNQPIEGLSDCDIMVRIACSGWNRRLWTFQEGALARRLLIQFADGIFDLDRAAGDLYSGRDVVFDLTLKTSIIKQVLGTRSLQIPQMDAVLRIKAIMSSLKFRSTSVLSDEPLCLGALLNLDVMRILRTSEKVEERMATLWSILPEVPADLALFGGRRLTAAAMGWAPATLLSPRDPGWAHIVKYSNPAHGVSSSEGLRVHFPGFELSCHSGTVFRKFYFTDAQTNFWYEVCCYRTLTSEDAVEKELNGKGSSVDGTVRVRPTEASVPLINLAMITQVAIFRPEVPMEVRTPGILALITKQEKDVIFARYVCDVTAQRVAVEDGSAAFTTWLRDLRGSEPMVPDDVQITEMLGAKTFESQAWCIG